VLKLVNEPFNFNKLKANLPQMMDLRIDFAFKLLFATGDTRWLISLLNAIFENKGIHRIIKSLRIINPGIEKKSAEDKFAILDIQAELDDTSIVCIEMHLYGLDELKYKVLRSWARVYGEEIQQGDSFKSLKPVICISFINGAIKDHEEKPFEQIHSIFHIMERETYQTLLTDLELHYINMDAFVKSITKTPDYTEEWSMFHKWLVLINHKHIQNKELLEDICKKEGEIRMATEALLKASEDKYARHAYLRRQDEILFYEKKLATIEELTATMKEKDAAILKKDTALLEKDTALLEKDTALLEKDALIARLQARLDEYSN